MRINLGMLEFDRLLLMSSLSWSDFRVHQEVVI
jgi:hypothetical protein